MNAGLIRSSSSNLNTILEDLKVLDVGCGGGILSEVGSGFNIPFSFSYPSSMKVKTFSIGIRSSSLRCDWNRRKQVVDRSSSKTR